MNRHVSKCVCVYVRKRGGSTSGVVNNGSVTPYFADDHESDQVNESLGAYKDALDNIKVSVT